jgi:hypothetical protein
LRAGNFIFTVFNRVKRVNEFIFKPVIELQLELVEKLLTSESCSLVNVKKNSKIIDNKLLENLSLELLD